MYDIIVIGAGPAGMAASLYSAKRKIKTLVISKATPDYQPDGLSVFKFKDLKQEFENQLKENSGFLELQNKEVIAMEKNVVSFSVEIKSGALYYSKCVIIATGEAETIFDLITYKDQAGKIKVDSAMKTNIPGIFAAGSTTAALAHDIFISAGQGAQAALSVLDYIGKTPN